MNNFYPSQRFISSKKSKKSNFREQSSRRGVISLAWITRRTAGSAATDICADLVSRYVNRPALSLRDKLMIYIKRAQGVSCGMSDILDMAHDMAKDLHEVGAMDDITMRVMDRICVPEKPSFTPAMIKKIRAKSRMSQPVFAQFLNVGATTVAQWEQGKKSPGGSSARLLDVIDRKGIEAII